MLELRQITRQDCETIGDKTELELYLSGKLVKRAQRPITLHWHALKLGFEFRPVKGYLFGGYYRNLTDDLYMAIV